MVNANSFDLKEMLLDKQRSMFALLSGSRKTMKHPTLKGDISEYDWKAMLRDHLPKRYEVDRALIIDGDGRCSDAIDIVIFDRQYSPTMYWHNSLPVVPRESVYAVIEVKQDMSKASIEYAGAKAASVRGLKCTSVPIPHASGVAKPKEPFRIPAGLVTLDYGWKEPFGRYFRSAIESLPESHQLDFGCCLNAGAFCIAYEGSHPSRLEYAPKDEALIQFLFYLSSCLQKLATVGALDFAEYAKTLKVTKDSF